VKSQLLTFLQVGGCYGGTGGVRLRGWHVCIRVRWVRVQLPRWIVGTESCPGGWDLQYLAPLRMYAPGNVSLQRCCSHVFHVLHRQRV
jgi:hypothetical protein